MDAGNGEADSENKARMIGAEVKLIDVEPGRFTIDVDKAASAIAPRTRAIIPVDVNGQGVDYEALCALAQARGLSIVCDAVEGLGSKIARSTLRR
jgi:dTDP-4-amino-4,6-dideoxygalactose transaminase